jgi:hypothetical protein
MIKLSTDEQRVIDGAEHDGAGWVTPKGVPADIMERLAKAGLVRFWSQRWQLTPQGFARSRMSNQT